MVSSAAKMCWDGDVAKAHGWLGLVALSPLVPVACPGPSPVSSKSICLILTFAAYFAYLSEEALFGSATLRARSQRRIMLSDRY